MNKFHEWRTRLRQLYKQTFTGEKKQIMWTIISKSLGCTQKPNLGIRGAKERTEIRENGIDRLFSETAAENSWNYLQELVSQIQEI